MGKVMQPKPASSTNLLALPEGTELVGDYRIKRVLGAGGFGITYLAEEIALGRLVTIKEYFPADFAARLGTIHAAPRSEGCADDFQWGLDRFIEEAQTLARFVHPNIVGVFRYFLANDTGYMVISFEEGGSFKSWLGGLKRAPRQAELDRILMPLLDALEFVHKASYLHRDIAPDNILIRKDGSPVLIDFGSARGEMISHSRTVSALVKPGYSPYEQYATTASKQGPWTDIYALGATLYHAISGKRPPDSPSRMVQDDYIGARESALSSYRASFLAAIDKALKLEVTERPQSIAAWRGMLLAPDTKRAGGGLGLRLALVRTLGRKRAAARAAAPVGKAAPEVRPPDKDQTLVPLPPDAPQPQGQLLDFIDALKARRLQRKGAANGEAAPAEATPALPRRKPGKPGKKKATQPSSPRPGAPPKRLFGFGRVPYGEEAPAGAEPARPATPVSPPVKARAGALDDKPPLRTPRRRRRWRLPSRRWRSLIYKLAAGLAIAWLAVNYQDQLPRYEGRGATVVTGHTTDLAQIGRLTGHTGAVTRLASDDARHWIVSAGADATLRIWNSLSGQLIGTIALDDGPATALALDDRRALTGHKAGTIVLWDLERAAKLHVYQLADAPIRALAFAGENQFAAASGAAPLTLFDRREPSPISALAEAGEHASGLLAAARSRPLLVTSAPERAIRVWRTDPRGLYLSYRGPSVGVSALAMAPNGRLIAGGSWDGSIRVWSTSSLRPPRAFRAHAGRVTSIALAPGERPLLASAGRDGAIKLWDLGAVRHVRLLRGHTGPVRAVGFVDAGRRLISAGDDGVIVVWNIATLPPGH
jgi:serine/threonine protein kinase/WD40 repeat protein